jgi:glycosyltransferase involved in cell wall biosynthesis
VLVPAFNEAPAVGRTVARIRETLTEATIDHEIIVIDDGSTDDTVAEATRGDAIVLRHPTNAGYGRALKTGLRHACGEIVAIADADGSYPPEALPMLIREMSRFDMVVGARQGQYYHSSRWKRLGRTLLQGMVLFITGTRVSDVNSGMRVFRKQIAIDNIKQIGNGFSFTTTLTLAMLLEGHFVQYLPVTYHARVGSSKVRLLRDIPRTMQIVVMATVAYNPIKLFLLLAALIAVGAVPCVLIDVLLAGGFHVGLILMLGFSASMVLFGIGLTTDIMRRLQ